MDAPQSNPNQVAYVQAARLLQEADVIHITAGAGMGVGSGLGTFRGQAAGVWPPLERLKLEFPEMSNPNRFRDEDKIGPKLAWSFWKWRYCAYTGNPPHNGYEILKSWSDSKPIPSFVFTSNIDGHFESSGFAVVECHGTVKWLQCQRKNRTCPNNELLWQPEKNEIEGMKIDPKTDEVIGPMPTCKGCGGIARPAVLMFGDGQVLDTRIEEQGEAYMKWLCFFLSSFDLFFLGQIH